MVSMNPRCWWLTRGVLPAQTSQTSCFIWFKGLSSTAWLRLNSWCLPWSLVLPHCILFQGMVPPSTTQTGSLGLTHNTSLSTLTSKPPPPIPFTLLTSQICLLLSMSTTYSPVCHLSSFTWTTSRVSWLISLDILLTTSNRWSTLCNQWDLSEVENLTMLSSCFSDYLWKQHQILTCGQSDSARPNPFLPPLIIWWACPSLSRSLHPSPLASGILTYQVPGSHSLSPFLEYSLPVPKIPSHP